MNWIKYRTCHSAGYGKWSYREFERHEDDDRADEKWLLDQLNNLDCELTTNSEHWRGIEGDIVEMPDQEWLVKQAEHLRGEVEATISQLSRIEALIFPQ